MFIHLQIRNFGRIVALDAEISPVGLTIISGPSGSGKSTIGRALGTLMWGCRPDGSALDGSLIRDGADEAEIVGTTAKGTVLRRVLRRKGDPTRSVTYAGGAEMLCAIEADFQAHMKLLAVPSDNRKYSPLRHITVPMAWTERAASSGARELRDLLMAVSGLRFDLRAETARILGAPLRDGDLVCREADDATALTKAAEAQRTAANRRLDELTGKRVQAAAALTAIPADEVVTAEARTDAESVLARAKGHAKHREALATWETAERVRTLALERAEAWRVERAEIDAREPEFDRTELRAKEAAVERLTAALAKEARALRVEAPTETPPLFSPRPSSPPARSDAPVDTSRQHGWVLRDGEADTSIARVPATSRRVTVYVHGSDGRESEWWGKACAALGWGEDEERARTLAGLAYEHAITYDVNDDGEGTPVTIDGRSIAAREADAT